MGDAIYNDHIITRQLVIQMPSDYRTYHASAAGNYYHSVFYFAKN
jgi:hypothetical protein